MLAVIHVPLTSNLMACCGARVPEETVSLRECEQSGHTSAYADVEGMRIHYVHAGSGRPLVLIHGLTGSTANWRNNMAACASVAKVYAVDLVNMGSSARLSGVDPGLPATADRVIAWMDALGIGEADIAGHSHGGAVAMMLAARHPDRVRSLILFAPANPFCNSAERWVRFYTSRVGSAFAQLVPILPRQVHMYALARMYGDRTRIAPGTLEGYVDGLRVPGTTQHILNILRNWFAEMRNLRIVLPRIGNLPVMLVWGDRDRAVSLRSARRLQRELGRAELVVLPGAGHVPFEEMPADCNRLMLRWLERLELPRYHPQSVPAQKTVAPKAASPAVRLPAR